MLKLFRNKFISLFLYFLFFIFSKTPLILNRIIGYILGRICFYFDFKYKYVGYKNLKLVYQQKSFPERVKIIKSLYSNLGMNLFEFFLFPRMKFLIPKIVDFCQDEEQLLKKYLSFNKGVIIFSSHFSNWELLGAVLALKNFPLAVFARETYIPEINKIVKFLRESVNEIVIYRGKKESMKDLIYAVKKEKYIIGVLIDQNIPSIKNVFVPFLGINSPTPISVVELAIKYNIPSVIGLIYRDRWRYKVMIKPVPLEVYSDKIKFVTEVNNVISEYISRYPSQWVWIHKRWN